MSRKIILMLKNTPILEYNVDEGLFNVLNNDLLPFTLKDKFRKLNFDDNTSYGKTRLIADSKFNNEAYNGWLRNRLLPIGRENSKKISLVFGQDPVPKIKLIYLCKGLSLTDNYWIKTSNSSDTWESVNIRNNSLSEAVAYVALHGSSLTLQDVPRTPEVTNQGAYAKAWLRKDDGLWLYKKGNKGTFECKVEASVSNILDKCNVRHVAYELAEENYKYSNTSPICVRCKCITTDDLMIVPAIDYTSYCISHDLNFDRECIRIDSDLYYKMMIVDYLVSNSDRHGMNWGLFTNSKNEIISMHPLFDHNNAFDREVMDNPHLLYQALPGKTYIEAARYAMKKVDFHFTENIDRNDFISERHYKSFMERAKELGIKTNLNERVEWMRKNAPTAIAKSTDTELIECMQSSWLDYLRNRYGL